MTYLNGGEAIHKKRGWAQVPKFEDYTVTGTLTRQIRDVHIHFANFNRWHEAHCHLDEIFL